jgi:hypothetical protein
VDQTNHFFNIGYGWLCKHCSAEDAEHQQQIPNTPRSTSHSNGKVNAVLPLASWTDSSRQALICQRCGIEETIAGGGSSMK